ncbi:MAG: hypothetical protein KR126chlam1_01317 [Chlamydiae bacterium]|nr:hypothetical protein [Chlamydiota bacterium]
MINGTLSAVQAYGADALANMTAQPYITAGLAFATVAAVKAGQYGYNHFAAENAPVVKSAVESKAESAAAVVTGTTERAEAASVVHGEQAEQGPEAADARAKAIDDRGLTGMQRASEFNSVMSYMGSMALFAKEAIMNTVYAVSNLVQTLFSSLFIYSSEGRGEFATNFKTTVMNLTNVVGSLLGVVSPHVGSWYTDAAVNYVAPATA